jgi:hypothetical protein
MLSNPLRGISRGGDPDSDGEFDKLLMKKRIYMTEQEAQARQGIPVEIIIQDISDQRMSADKAWKWACEWITQNGLGTVSLNGKIWKLEQIWGGDHITARKGHPLRSERLSLTRKQPRDASPPPYVPTITQAEHERMKQERIKRHDAKLDKLPYLWKEREQAHAHTASFDWKTIKEMVKFVPTLQKAYEILRDWTGEDTKRAEKSEVREFLRFPSWVEVNMKLLRKRLKHIK